MIDSKKIMISSEILNLISEIDEFKGAWLQIGRLTQDRLLALKKVATIESIGSSTRIEGAKLSDREIEALLSRVDLKSFQSRDEQEVAGYAEACDLVFSHYVSVPISESSIKQIHSLLLKYSDKDVRHRDEYKKLPIQIEAFDSQGKSMGVIFETTSPLETPNQMHELVTWTKNNLDEKDLHPLIVIALFVVIFLAIHPFQDGNGRLSRLLTSLLMMKCGYRYVAYSSLESIIEANKESYYLALQKTQKSWQNGFPDWTPWLLFFLHCLQRQKKHLEVKISKENLLIKDLSPLSRQVLELLRSHGELGIREIEILTRANINTLKKTLLSLVHADYIKMNGKGKATTYSLLSPSPR